MAAAAKIQLSQQIDDAKRELATLRVAMGISLSDPIPQVSSRITLSENDVMPLKPDTQEGKSDIQLAKGSNGREVRTIGRNSFISSLAKKRQDRSSINQPAIAMPISNQETPADIATIIENENIVAVDRFSRRLNSADMSSLGLSSQTVSRGNPGVIGSTDSKEAAIIKARSAVMELLSSTKYDRLTISRLESLGHAKKTGFMMKQSKYLGRWIKRYFVLSGSAIVYFDDEHLRNGKEGLIRSDTNVSYTSKDHCFLIKGLTNPDGSSIEEWKLMTEDESVMEDWMAAINAHIHIQFKKERYIRSDYWDQGDISISVWTVPLHEDAAVNAVGVGIRTLPLIDAPKTNEGIYPGSAVEVVQIIESHDNTYLRLADDRGWVFLRHPKEHHHLFERLAGSYVEDSAEYKYPESHEKSLNVFTGPHALNPWPDLVINPGTSITCSAKWTPDNADEQEHPITYLKLAEERLWITANNVDTGEVLLEKIR